MRAYQRLTYEQQCQFYGLLKTDLKQGEIAVHIGVSAATISRELRSNTGRRGYRPKQARVSLTGKAASVTGKLTP